MNTFSTASAMALTQIKRDMLNYLCRTGIVTPTHSRKQGRCGYGIERRYSFSDLICFKVVKKLTASGVSPLKVKSAIRELHKMGISLSRIPSSHIVIFDKSVYQWDGTGNPFRVADGQQAFGFILDVSSIHGELLTDIKKLAA